MDNSLSLDSSGLNWKSVGEIREHHRDERGVDFEWTIPDFYWKSFYKQENKNYRCWSPEIKISDSVWKFRITRHKWRTGECIALLKESESTPKPICISFSVKKLDGTEDEIVRDQRYSETAIECVLVECLHRSDLQIHNSGIVPFGEVIFICKLRNDLQPSIGAGRSVNLATQTEELSDTAGQLSSQVNTKDVSTLQKHLQDLLLNGDDHDVTIKVGKQEFRAHKNMLRARSPVFSAMFKHQMKESTDGSISIEDCDPDAFGEFLKYVYTGKVENLSPSNAVGLYYVADKYDFSGLKERCVQFLKTSLSTTVICDVIDLATNHHESGLLECAMNFFSKHTKEILITLEWQRFAKNNFTTANELYIKALESFANKGE